MRFRATQRYAVDHVAFEWRAHFVLACVVAFDVTDAYVDRNGKLQVRFLGLPLQRRAGQEIDTGEAYRYLAELPWVPHAMLSNRELRWGESDEHHVQVVTDVSGEETAVSFAFNASGEITTVQAASRPRAVGRTSVLTPWGGEFSDYGTLAGVRMPTRGEVFWELPTGRFVYWRGHITAARIVDEPFDG